MNDMNRATVGLLAHVDAGKTTLAEAILYRCGLLRSLGRVDHGDTTMDYDPLERERGITIFAAQAHVEWGGWELTLLDTPGHVDFSAETERMLQVLDYAILVISGTDGVQAHTRTLWRLLVHYQIPTVLFVTKMDLARSSRAELLDSLCRELGDGVVDFSPDNPQRDEALAMCAEPAMEEYLSDGAISPATLGDMLAAREIFPCFFGSGLKLEGIDAFLDTFTALMKPRLWPEQFGARVFKITHDPQGVRLTHLKVTGGTLRVRDSLFYDGLEEKATQLRRYQGGRFTAAEEVLPGQVCAVVGLSTAR